MPKTLAQGQSMAWLRKRAYLRGVASPPTGGGVLAPFSFTFDGLAFTFGDEPFTYGAS